MVNRAGVAIVGVLVVISLSVGVLIGMTIGGGGGPAAEPPDDTGNGNGNEDANGGSGTTTTTGTATANETVSRTVAEPGPTPIPPRRFRESVIESEVQEAVNERRAERGLDELHNRGDVGDRLRAMARSHSVNMSVESALVHTIYGQSSANRYRTYDLYDQCTFQSSDGNYIIHPDYPESAQLEALGQTFAGTEYFEGGQSRFNRNETDVAQAVVRNWFNTTTYRQRLLLDNANRIGVGVELTNDSSVWVTANLC